MGEPRTITRKPVLVAAIVAVVLAAGGGGAYTVRRVVMEAQACETVKAQVADTGLISKVTDGSPTVVVLGDSYSVGAGLDDRTKAWPTLAGKAEGLATHVAGVGGTGFVNQGPCGGQSFGQRVRDVLALEPDTLIIAGGVNDSDSTPGEVQASATAVLRLTASVPTVIVVGPANAPAKDNLPAIDAALAEATEASGRKYISALGWELEYQPDRLHPTEAGQAVYARNIEDAIP